MLTVEDCLIELNQICRKDKSNVIPVSLWDRKFISDLADHATRDSSISTAQSSIALKIISQYRGFLESNGISNLQLDQLLLNPTYRKPLYESTYRPREVRWIGDNKLVFCCKYNANIVNDIKRLKGGNLFVDPYDIRFYKKQNLWIVNINSTNWQKAMDVIKQHGFAFDDEVTEFFCNVANTHNQKSEAVIQNNEIIVKIQDDDMLNEWINVLQAFDNV